MNVKRNQQLERIITAISLIVIGILFCLNLASKAISIVIGSVFIALGALLLIILIVKKSTLINAIGIIGGLYITLGISFIAINFIGVLISLTPYLLIVFGSILLIDAFLLLLVRRDKTIIFIIEFLLAAAFITFGILLLASSSFRAHIALIFGILLICLGVYSLVKIALKKGNSNE